MFNSVFQFLDENGFKVNPTTLFFSVHRAKLYFSSSSCNS